MPWTAFRTIATYVIAGLVLSGTSCHLGSDASQNYWVADNRFHSIYFEPDVPQNMRDAFTFFIWALGLSTELETSVTTDRAAADVVIRTEGGFGHWARVGCLGTPYGTDPDRVCPQFHLDVDLDRPGAAANLAHIACHEIGHTLGLRHRQDFPAHGSAAESDSCMFSGHIEVNTAMDDDDLNEIDAQY